MEKVTQVPIKYMERKKNMVGEGYVSCQVSGRYLKVQGDSALLVAGEFITIDVMTEETKNDMPKKICELIVTREELLRGIERSKT